MTESIYILAKKTIEEVSEVSGILKAVSTLPKKSIISRKNLIDLEGKLWLSLHEYERSKKEHKKRIATLRSQKRAQIRLLKEAYKNEEKRVTSEYSSLKTLFERKRTSRKKLSERKMILENEFQEMIQVIEREYSLHKKNEKRKISEYKKKLQQNISFAANALLELKYLESALTSIRGETPFVYKGNKNFSDILLKDTENKENL